MVNFVTMGIQNEQSEIQIKSIGGKSVLTQSKIYRPLKVFSLQEAAACQIIFSNYGGGFVEGDAISLKINCEAHTATVFSSQANTRIYKSEQGKASTQNIEAKLSAGAFVAMLCDPLVLHARSIFEQRQTWELETEAVLLFTDWFEGGRVQNGERFAFESYHSELKISYEGKPLVWDRFQICPHLEDPNSPGAFLKHSSYINLFLVGAPHLEKVQKIQAILAGLSQTYFLKDETLVAKDAAMFGVLTQINADTTLIRCSAMSSDLLQPFMKQLAAALEVPDLLGFNPDHRL